MAGDMECPHYGGKRRECDECVEDDPIGVGVEMEAELDALRAEAATLRARVRELERDRDNARAELEARAHEASQAGRDEALEVARQATHRMQIERDRALGDAARMYKALREIERHHVERNREVGRPEGRSKTLRLARAALRDLPGDAP